MKYRNSMPIGIMYICIGLIISVHAHGVALPDSLPGDGDMHQQYQCTGPLQIDVKADSLSVEEGRSVALDVVVRDSKGVPVPGCLLMAYVNGKRWGAHELADGDGKGRIILAMPNIGPQSILVRAVPDFFSTYLIWASNVKTSPAFLLKRFSVQKSVSTAKLYVASRGNLRFWCNGKEIFRLNDVHQSEMVEVDPALFRLGENILAVEVEGTGKLDAVSCQLHLLSASGYEMLLTDDSWEAWDSAPAMWPLPSVPGERVRVLGRVQDAIWSEYTFQGWPGLIDREAFFAGDRLPDKAEVSCSVVVDVIARDFQSHREPNRLIGIEWGSYFFKEMFYWHNAPAVPIVGYYDSYNRDVIRQHALWLMDMGVDFLLADWPVDIARGEDGIPRWSNRPDSANAQIHATQVTLDVYADMLRQGYPVPQMVIMPFLGNGPSNTPETVNEQLEWLYHYFIRNPRFEGLWVLVDNKPLVVLLHNTMTPAWEAYATPIVSSHFSIRYMAAQLQHTRMEKHGYWSWMDGVPDPIVTMRDGVAETATPSAAFFGLGGWLAEDAWGRRNGVSLIRSFKSSLESKPRFVLLHQWNEFTGQFEGYPYESGIYGDSYSVELSDDIEPTSLTADGYRGDKGGYGYYYMNLTKALIAIYKGFAPDDTLISVYPPMMNGVVSEEAFEIGWETIGRAPESFDVLLDSELVAKGIKGNKYLCDLSEVKNGEHVITVIANGARTRFKLAAAHEDLMLEKAVQPKASVTFYVKKKG